MKTAFTGLLLLLLCLPALAQDKPAEALKGADEKITLKLKSGEEMAGTLKKLAEDGVSLDIGDGATLFVRWGFVRGDKHLDLRKRATDYKKLASIERLADFCHDNAMDTEEAFVVVAAIKLEPRNKALRERLAKLPKPPGLEVPEDPDQTQSQPKPPEPEPKQPDTPAKPKEPDTPPVRPTFKVMIEMVNEDAAAVTWLTDEFTKVNYPVVTSKRDHEMLLKVDLTLTLVRNPKFMGAELYAVYDGKVKYELFKKGEKKAFASGSFETKNIRKDSKAEAMTSCRKDVLSQAFPGIHSDLEHQR